MNIKKSLKTGAQKLEKISTTPQLDAEVLLIEAFKKSAKKFSKISREFLFAHPEYELGSANQIYRKFLQKRARGVPIAYLIGHKEFYGLNFLVNKNVLIPRPETEILVEEALKVIKSKISKNFSHIRKKLPKIYAIADIGTGSGNIIISLATTILSSTVVTKFNKKKIRFYATDISAKALEVAKKNAQKHKVLSIIKFYQGDLLEALPKNIKLDLICANLPYLKKWEMRNVKWEPTKTLNGGKDGLKIIKKLITQAPRFLKSKGIILLEIGTKQTRKLKKYIFQKYPKIKIKIFKDLAKLDRVLEIQF